MAHTGGSLEQKIRDTVCNHLRNGNKIVAIKFFYEVTMTPLLESKQFVEALQANSTIPFGDQKYHEFLSYLEQRDFGGAASRLLDDLDPSTPRDAIEDTLRIAKLLDLDVSALELPTSLGMLLADSSHAQAIITDRALQRIRERMVERLMRSGTGRLEAEKLVDEARGAHLDGKYVPPDPRNVSLAGLDPHLAHVLQLLLGPVPDNVQLATTHGSIARNSASQLTTSHGEVANDRREVWFHRIGGVATFIYAAVAMAGLAAVLYSYTSITPLTPFSMNADLSEAEQSEAMTQWSSVALPAHWRWFNSSIESQFSPVRLEPGLPLAYAGEEWSWEKRVDNINQSASEIRALITRCHEVLIALYAIAIFCAGFHWFQRDIASGILMTAVGAFGIPLLTSQLWRWEFDNPYWLGLLLIPGIVALVASVLDLTVIAPKTDQRKELRAFWLAAFGVAVCGLFLGWAILEGHHVKSGVGIGLFGGAWLMLQHGMRYLRSKRPI